MRLAVERTRHGWRVGSEGLTVDFTHWKYARGTIRGVLSIYRDSQLAYRDSVCLTSERARARVLKRATEKGLALDERALLALEEACRLGRGAEAPPSSPQAETDGAPPQGADVLAAVEAFLRRYLALPSEHAAVAVTLWAAHAHALDAAESTPRLAFLSPEPECGKTRALEVLELLVPRPMLAVNATPAALFRAVADQQDRPTILFDEIDTVFGPKAKENEELRGLLNAGHRRSGVAYRCVGEGTAQEVRGFPAYAAVALAGIGHLPDTILSRSIIIRMRRRRPDEPVLPFRRRIAEAEGRELRESLARWAHAVAAQLALDPEVPAGITDRAADLWEPLFAIADAAGGEWPERARAAALALLAEKREREPSLGVQLLKDIRAIFESTQAEALSTATLLEQLWQYEESPWSNLRGRPLDARGLAKRLRDYGITPKTIRIGETTLRGYERAAFLDAWSRYIDDDTTRPATEAQQAQQEQQSPSDQGKTASDTVAEKDGCCGSIRNREGDPQHEMQALMRDVADVADVADFRQGVQRHNNGRVDGEDIAERLLRYGDRVGWPLYARSVCQGARVPIEIGIVHLRRLVESGVLIAEDGNADVAPHAVLRRSPGRVGWTLQAPNCVKIPE